MKRINFFKNMFVGIFTIIGLLFVIKMIQKFQKEIKDQFEYEDEEVPMGI